MKRPGRYVSLEDLGRVRLSRHFQFRNFLYSEIGNFYGRSNIPDDPDLAVEAGSRLALEILDPLVETFGPIDIRSGYRSASLNHFGATEVKPQKCGSNEVNAGGGHIWDLKDDEGRIGATVSVSIPWFAIQYNLGRDWRDLAWWLVDHLGFHSVTFFPKDAAFNIGWRDGPDQKVLSYIAPKGTLFKPGMAPDPDRASRYADFPAFRAITYPEVPNSQ